MANLKVVQFPDCGTASVPAGLRALADRIEAGDFGDAHNLAWVIDAGDGRIECGLLGHSPEPGPVGYFLFGLAMHKLVAGSSD